VTGWQGNEGGWNPQQNPYGQQYGGGQRYGGDPYGSDPYPGQPMSEPYAATYGTSAYPAYQTGWGPPPPPEPPKRSKAPIVLSVVAILAVVGTVVTIVLLNRDSGSPDPVAGPASTTSSTTTRSTPRPPSSRPPSGSQQPSIPPGKTGWSTIPMPGGSYQVPADWQKSGEKRDSGLGVTFDGGTVVGEYSCGGKDYFRGFTATGDVQGKNGAALDLNQTVADFAKSFGTKFYNSPKVDVPTPTGKTVSGKQVALVTAKVTNTPSSECDADTGEVAILGVAIDQGVRMLVVVNDLAGGPANPPALPDALAEDILSTVNFS
jgi:hypothetical protein